MEIFGSIMQLGIAGLFDMIYWSKIDRRFHGDEGFEIGFCLSRNKIQEMENLVPSKTPNKSDLEVGM